MGGYAGLSLLSVPNKRVLFALLGSGIMGLMHRGVRGSQSYLCSCKARLCRRQELSQDTAAWEAPQNSTEGQSASVQLPALWARGWRLCSLLRFLLPPLQLPLPYLLLLRSLKINTTVIILIILRAEHMCTLANLEVSGQLPGVSSFSWGI